MAIDSHAHYVDIMQPSLKEKIKNINNNSSLESIINISFDINTSSEAKQIATDNDKFYSTIGISPLFLCNTQDILKLIDIYNDDKKIVAIGEIGLDRSLDNIKEQEYYFTRQLDIANYLKLPVIVNSGNMEKTIIDIFKHKIKPKYGCVFRSQNYSDETIVELLKMGYYLSFGGQVTFKLSDDIRQKVKMIPPDNLLVETNSPYSTPEPFRSELNSSIYLEYIIAKIAEIKNLTYEETEEITSRNTKTLFKKMQ